MKSYKVECLKFSLICYFIKMTSLRSLRKTLRPLRLIKKNQFNFRQVL